MRAFDRALSVVLKHEGGYVDHPRDPGGATNLGITIGTLSDWLGRPATKADVKALTPAKVKPIYRDRYWRPINGDNLPAGVDLVTFDAAVNSGVSRGAKWTQQAVGVTADGKIGAQTLTALAKANSVAVIKKATDLRLRFLQGLKTWATFGKGWGARVGHVRATALAWAGESAEGIRQDADAIEAGSNKDASLGKASGAGSAGSVAASATQVDWQALLALGLVAAVLIGLALFLHSRSKAKRDAARAARAVAAQLEAA